MQKLTLTVLLLYFSTAAFCQHHFFAFKKKNKTIALYSEGSYIAFQGHNREWFSGYITRIQNDSFYIKPMVVRFHLFGRDTVWYDIQSFVFSDVYAMPKKGIQIDFIDGRFQITRSGGHVHWYWVKSGWLFRAGAAGYAALYVANGIIKDDFSFAAGTLAITGGVYLFGELLRHTYSPVLPLRKKYRLQSIKL